MSLAYVTALKMLLGQSLTMSKIFPLSCRLGIKNNCKPINYSKNIECNTHKITSLETLQDRIGPPDSASNLRTIEFCKSPNETRLQRKYRQMRIDVQDWNQQFWSNHNKNFNKEREKFISLNAPPGKSTLSADEMSVFYKTFLDKNWKMHTNYNIQWYKKNIQIFHLSVKVALEKIINKIYL